MWREVLGWRPEKVALFDAEWLEDLDWDAQPAVRQQIAQLAPGV